MLGQVGVLLKQHQSVLREILAVPRVGVGPHLVAFGLPRLREEDQWRRIGGLEAEREVQQNEGMRRQCTASQNRGPG